MAEKSPSTWRPTMRRRLVVTAAVFGLWAAVIQGRLVYFQIVRHADLVERAQQHQTQKQTVPARRGRILDRNGEVLALDVPAPTIFADPSAIEDPERAADALCSALADCTPQERQRLRAGLASGKRYLDVRRQASPDQADRVAGLRLHGIGSRNDSIRRYPNKELASHVLGFVNASREGGAGIEWSYNDRIKGQDGFVIAQVDRKGSAFNRLVEKAPTVGATLELTIDEPLQHVVERELRAGVLENGATAGTAIVMSSSTGEVLVLANYPSFNPNAYGEASAELFRNRAAQSTYEPGSTFKIVTASAALEQHVITPDERIDTSGGSIRFGRNLIEDTHVNGVMSFRDVFVKSSNVGAIKVAIKLGPEPLIEYARRFGFGRRSWDLGDDRSRRRARDFPGEASGVVWDASQLPDSELASVSIGYHISVTPLQMAAAVSSIANGGNLVQPRVVRAVIENDIRRNVPMNVVGRSVTAETAAEVTGLMEEVVSRGTGTAAQIPGYTVAAKTGTAQKLVDGKYSQKDHVASIVGFVPSRKPAYTIVVVIDSPRGRKGYYGGPVAGPIFKSIAEAALRLGGVPPTLNAPPPLLVRREPEGAHEVPASGPIRSTPVVAASASAPVEGLLPDLTGMSAREAARTLSRLGLRSFVNGTGLVIGQRPAAGTPLEPGLRATLWLGRQIRTSGIGAP